MNNAASMPTLRSTLVWLLALTMIAGCQRLEDAEIELTDSQQQQIEPYILDEPPEMDESLGVEFEESIELVGVDIEGNVAPGEDVEATWYWRALEEIDEDWQIFVHFDSEEERFRQNLDHYPLEGQMNERFRLYHFQEGDVVADTQRFTVREDYPLGEAVFYVGLFQGERRAEVTGGDPATDADRAIGPSFEVSPR